MFRAGKIYSSDPILLQKALDFFMQWNSQESEIEVNSSGSTGKPKQIPLRKNQLILSANKTNQYFNLNSDTTAFLCLSTETIAGKMMLVRAFVGNYKIRIEQASSNPLKTCEESFDFMAIVPLQLATIVKETPEKLALIQTIIVGGAPVSNNLIAKLKSLKKSIFQTFGMTETVSHIAIRKIGFEESKSYEALQGVTFTAPEGNLEIHYPELLPEPLLTNDFVQLIDSTHFEWIGRTDFIINSGGIKFNPEAIEQKLASLISVPFFISSIPDDLLGNKLTLVLESELVISLKKSDFIRLLPKYEIPRMFVLIPIFERTTSGKINRKQIQSKILIHDWKPIL